MAAGLSVVLLAVLWFAGSGSLLRLAIPAWPRFLAWCSTSDHSDFVRAVFALGLVPRAAAARRIVDWRFGWDDPNMILLSPLLVSGVAGLAFLRKDGKAWQ